MIKELLATGILGLQLLGLSHQALAPKAELGLAVRSPIPAVCIKTSSDGYAILEPCAWRQAQHDAISASPKYATAILRMSAPRVLYGRKQEGGPYGETEKKNPLTVKVFLVPGDVRENTDSIIHEMKHSIVCRLMVGDLTKEMLHLRIDMMPSNWQEEAEINVGDQLR